MAANKINQGQLNATLNAMQAGTGNSRVDEYYFATNDISIDDLQSKAFNKNLIITITPIYGVIYKMIYTTILT